MLTLRKSHRSNAAGFSLVELMVALVIGLIVVGAVLALVLAIMKSNRQTLQSTRLNQELRATMAVIISDLRRARGTSDPLTEAKLPLSERYGRDIVYSTANCIRYAYADAPGGACHAIMRATTGINADRIFLHAAAPTTTVVTGTPPVTNVECSNSCQAAGNGTKLGSDQIAITALTFTPTSPTTPAADTVRSFDVTITGHLIDQDAELNSISRSVTQSVQIRSLGAGN